jgi:hypothetical protein
VFFVLVLSVALKTPLRLFIVGFFDGFLGGRGFQPLNATRDVGSRLSLLRHHPAGSPVFAVEGGDLFYRWKGLDGGLRVWGRNESEVEKDRADGDWVVVDRDTAS